MHRQLSHNLFEQKIQLFQVMHESLVYFSTQSNTGVVNKIGVCRSWQFTTFLSRSKCAAEICSPETILHKPAGRLCESHHFGCLFRAITSLAYPAWHSTNATSRKRPEIGMGDAYQLSLCRQSGKHFYPFSPTSCLRKEQVPHKGEL